MPPLFRSLPRVCVALGLPTANQLSQAAEAEYKDGSSFLEFRLDYLENVANGLQLIRKLKAKHSDLTILATCRHREHGGFFNGSLDRQMGVLEDAALAGAVALDLEIESAECMKERVAGLRSLAALILSYHNFESTPALETALRRLQRIPADAYKIATTSRKPEDNLRVMQFVREHKNGPLIVFAMSEIGMPTRVLAPSLGSSFTYASPSHLNGTAPGQISSRLMRSLFRADKLTSHSRVFGVVADPVSHSKSPLIHNRAFQTRRVDAVYLPFLVPPMYLGEWMKFATALPVHGFSVTIPHKQRIMRYLDKVEPLAKRIGAVNTVWRKGGKWRGTNTDADGVLKPLSKHLRLLGASVLIAGYGGAARAAAIALSDAGSKITVTGRQSAGARALASAVKGHALTIAEAERLQFDALVHATPCGMSPDVDAALFQHVPADVVLDMVYNPHETMLLKRAREQGRTLIHGADMLLEQAARQFEIWTGESAPQSAMRSALELQ